MTRHIYLFCAFNFQSSFCLPFCSLTILPLSIDEPLILYPLGTVDFVIKWSEFQLRNPFSMRLHIPTFVFKVTYLPINYHLPIPFIYLVSLCMSRYVSVYFSIYCYCDLLCIFHSIFFSFISLSLPFIKMF